ncbi:MAG: PAS domain S-box protein, partial [Deltaproteobacteria bacterium]|nr:PAS domain S-box protein [Deltaproteobacteria bacterium]
ITLVNDRGLKIFGYSREELLGRTWFDACVPERVKKSTHAHFNRLMSGETKPPAFVENLILRKDGRERIVSWENTVIRDSVGKIIGTLSSGEDITERKKAEEVLKESEERYRSMMEALNDPVYICSPEYRVEYMNPAMIQWAGGEAIGEPCHKIIYGLDERCDWCVHDRVMQGEPAKTEVVSPKDHRSYIIAHSPIFHTDGSVSKMTIFTDVTDRKRAEEALLKKEAARAAAEEADRSKSEFLAVMSHELRTPLTGVLGFAQTMRRVAEKGKLTPEKQNSYLDSITEAGEHLAAMIDDLLDISQIEAGQMDVYPEPINLRELLESLHSNMDSQIVKKGLSCETDIPEGFPLVRADKKRLTQVMLNLWGNAVKFTERGSIRVRALVLEESGQLLISISDTGPGIAPEYLDQIFEKFKRVGDQDQIPGTGLGLAITKRLVELMDGSIWVESEMGQGSDFRFTLPKWREEEEWKTRA